MSIFEETIDRIVEIEWNMFSAVNEGGPKASCQEDRSTFEGMRKGQFRAWSQDMLDAYLEDVEKAKAEGRNIAAEKYIHMMKVTDPRGYEHFSATLPATDEEHDALAAEVGDLMFEQSKKLHEDYPVLTGFGRPLVEDRAYPGVTSVDTYQRGELATYSTKTLKAFKEHLLDLASKGVSLAEKVQEESVKYYGYADLDEAEAYAIKRANSLPIEVSLGVNCPLCNDSAQGSL